MTAAAAEGTAARKGRPRDERLDEQITTAALEVLAVSGFERFAVEEVALRAGVAKTTIYRRFPCRDDLITGALLRLNDELPSPPAPGPVRDRLVEVLGALRLTTPTSLRGRILLQAVQSGDPRLSEWVQERVIAPRRMLIRAIVEEGVAAGEVRPDVDAAALLPVLLGPILFLSMWSETSATRDISVESVVDTVLTGLMG